MIGTGVGLSERALSLFVWYTITSGDRDEPLEIGREELRDALSDAGIDPDFLPPQGRSIDAFRSATSGVVDDYDHHGTPVQLVIRQTASDVLSVTRTVYLTWEKEGKAMQRKVATLHFLRPRRNSAGRIQGTERLKTQIDMRLEGMHRERVTDFVHRVVTSYELKQRRLSAHAVRAVVRDFLLNCGAVSVQGVSGGAYLLAERYQAEAYALRDVVRRCGQQCRLRVMRLPDEPDMYEMALESIDGDIENRAEGLAREIHEWVEGNPLKAPTARQWGVWMAACRALQDLLLGYMDAYQGATFERAGAALDKVVTLSEEMGSLITATAR